jgi:hypothetical protein
MNPTCLKLDETDSESDESQPCKADQTKSTLSSMFILPVILLGMVTETVVSMVINTIESFYPNFYSVEFDKQEGYVGTVLAIAGLMYCISTITSGTSNQSHCDAMCQIHS